MKVRLRAGLSLLDYSVISDWHFLPRHYDLVPRHCDF